MAKQKGLRILALIFVLVFLLSGCSGMEQPPLNNGEDSGNPAASESPAMVDSVPSELPIEKNVDIGAAREFFSADGKTFDMLGYLNSLQNFIDIWGSQTGFSNTRTISLDDWADVTAAGNHWSISIQARNVQRQNVVNGESQDIVEYDLGAFFEIPYTFVDLEGGEHNMYLTAFSVGIPIEFPAETGQQISGDMVEIEYELDVNYLGDGERIVSIVPGSQRMQLDRHVLDSVIIMLQRINDNPTACFDPLSGFEHNIIFNSQFVEADPSLTDYKTHMEGTAEEQFYYYGVTDTDHIMEKVHIKAE